MQPRLAWVLFMVGCASPSTSSLVPAPALPDHVPPGSSPAAPSPSGAAPELLGITADDHLIVRDPVTTEVRAETLAGTAPIRIGFAAAADVHIAGRAVFVWEQVDELAGLGRLKALTGGTVRALATSSLVGLAAADRTGTRLLYTDRATGPAGDVILDAAGAQTRLVERLQPRERGATGTRPGCRTALAFVGDRAVIAACPSGEGGAIVSAYDAAGRATPLARDVVSLQTDAAQARLWMIRASGEALLMTDAGAPRFIDAHVVEGRFADDAIVYRTAGAELRRWPALEPLTLFGEARHLVDVSADGRAVVFEAARPRQTVRFGTAESAWPVSVAAVPAPGDAITRDGAWWIAATRAPAGRFTLVAHSSSGDTVRVASRATRILHTEEASFVFDETSAEGQRQLRLVDLDRRTDVLLSAELAGDFYLTSGRHCVVWQEPGGVRHTCPIR